MRQTKQVQRGEVGAADETASPVSGIWTKVDHGRPELEGMFARGDAVRRGLVVADETERTRLINELSRLIREPQVPACTRAAGLTLIGWLARRMPGEAAHSLGVNEARESERRLRAARKAAR
jgi:hypothetical protein